VVSIDGAAQVSKRTLFPFAGYHSAARMQEGEM